MKLERVSERPRLAAESVAHELVVDGLGRQVHERELVRAFVRANVLVRDRVDVRLNVAHELLRVLIARGIVLGLDQPVEVVQRELGVDGHERTVEADDGIDPLAASEAVLKLVLVTGEGIGEQVAQE